MSQMAIHTFLQMLQDFQSVSLTILRYYAFTQPAFTFLKLIIETLEQGVKYVQS